MATSSGTVSYTHLDVYKRQVRGWAERWSRAKTEDLPQTDQKAVDRIVRWLNDGLPPSVDATLVHNDYKLDNVMLRPAGDRVEAVLDWEMTTIGDPLEMCIRDSAFPDRDPVGLAARGTRSATEGEAV